MTEDGVLNGLRGLQSVLAFPVIWWVIGYAKGHELPRWVFLLAYAVAFVAAVQGIVSLFSMVSQ